MTKRILTYIFELILLFIFFAFTEASMNVIDWTVETRITFVFYSIAMLLIDMAFKVKVN